MRLLVTGGAGFVGTHIAEYFSEKGYEVTALDNLKRGEILGKDISLENNLEFLKSLENVSFVNGDVKDSSSLEGACREVDVIIHAAAQVAVTTSLQDPRNDFEINALGTFNMLEAARKNDCSVLYCSTNKVYGDNVNEIPINEKENRYEFAGGYNGVKETFSTDLCEHTPYGSSKFAGDVYTQDYSHVYGLKTGVFRMSCIYGSRQFGVEDQGWVAWFTIANMLGKPVTIYGDGKQVRDVLYVTDLVKAYDQFINSKLKHEVFNVGGGPENTLSLLELTDLLEELTGKQMETNYDDWRPSDQKVYISDITKAKEKLDWEPKISPREGVENLVNWVEQNKQLF